MDKKALVNQYKARTKIGGIYAVKNMRLNKWYIDATPDLAAAENRFNFFGSTQVKVEQDYKAQNGEDFIFEALEELEQGKTQSDKEFKNDLTVLKNIWLEKLSGQELY